jgi:hypothetical protein
MVDRQGKPAEPKVIIQPSVFTGLVAVLTLAVGFLLVAKAVVGWSDWIAQLLSILSLVCCLTGWVLLHRGRMTVANQRGVLFFMFLAMAFVTADVLVGVKPAWIYRASAVVWWPVAAAFGLDWLRRRKGRAGKTG